MFHQRLIYFWIDDKDYVFVPNNPPHVFDELYARAVNTPLLRKYGLSNWKIDCHDIIGKAAFGRCNYAQKTITVNPKALYLLNSKQVDRIIIHEVAHALCPSCGHNETWQAKDLELGGNGKEKVDAVELKCVNKQFQYYQVKFE